MGFGVEKEIGQNGEELSLSYSNNLLSYVIAAIKKGTGSTHPIILRRGDAHGIKIDTNAIAPVTDGNMKLGLASSDPGGAKRWTNLNAILVNGADFCFENGYRLTEANHVYADMDPQEGIFLMDPDWNPIMYLDRSGNLTVKGRVEEVFEFRVPDVPRRD